jgi:hypothetical protein
MRIPKEAVRFDEILRRFDVSPPATARNSNLLTNLSCKSQSSFRLGLSFSETFARDRRTSPRTRPTSAPCEGFIMSYQLVFTEKPTGVLKAVGENVFLDDLSPSYKVYLFYYAGSMPNRPLEDGLRNLGESTGQNLFVNIGKLDDPKFDSIANRFEISIFPVIVITAVSDLASLVNAYLSAFARLDSKHLINDPDKTLQCAQEVFNLFLRGKVAEALSNAKSTQTKELLKWLGGLVTGVLKPMLKFIEERDITFSLVEGKFELKKSGG